jgi:hypothetical protein
MLGDMLVESSQSIPVWKRLEEVVEKEGKEGEQVRYSDKIVRSS